MSRVFQPDSDDDSEIEDEEERTPSSAPGPGRATGEKKEPPNLQPLPPDALKSVYSLTLEEGGDGSLEEISRTLEEAEMKSIEELENQEKEFKKTTSPKLKKEMEELESRVEKLRKVPKTTEKSSKEEKEAEDINEKLLEELTSQLKKLSTRLMFPQSVHRSAADGLYFAVDDFWLDSLSGKFDLELLPCMGSDVARVVFVLTGEQQEGASVRLHLTNFQLKADSVVVPSLSYDEMDVETTFTGLFVLSFDQQKRQWSIEEDDFKVDIKEFEGPFGLSKAVLSAILAILLPVVRKRLLKDLPEELGVFLSSLPCPLQVSGSFGSWGQPNYLEASAPMIASTSVSSLLGHSPAALLHLEAIQRSMKRRESDRLVSLVDLIRYQRKHRRSSQWKLISELWQDAAAAYHALSCRYEPSDTADDPSLQHFPTRLSVERVFLGASRAAKMPVEFLLDVKRVEGQFGMKTALQQSNAFARRMMEKMDSAKEKLEKLTVSEKHLLENVKKMVQSNADVFQFLLQRVDFMQGQSSVHVESGEDAQLTGRFDHLSGQFPAALWVGLPANKIIGGNILVPTLTKLETTKEGVLQFNFYELSSVAMLERCRLHQWLQDDLPDDEEHSAKELAELQLHRPQFSLVMDQPVQMSPGGTLFTVQVGPQERDWVPPGAKKSPTREKYLAEIRPLGESCPLLVQTSEQVKMLGKIPTVTTRVQLAALVAFLSRHFDDLEALLDVLQLSSGAEREVCLQYVSFAKIVLSILSKYTTRPGLQLDVDMATRVISNASDIIVCLENRLPEQSAVKIRAKIDFGDIISDLLTLKDAIFSCINHNATMRKK